MPNEAQHSHDRLRRGQAIAWCLSPGANMQRTHVMGHCCLSCSNLL